MSSDITASHDHGIMMITLPRTVTRLQTLYHDSDHAAGAGPGTVTTMTNPARA
jgi:hypothetical protein